MTTENNKSPTQLSAERRMYGCTGAELRDMFEKPQFGTQPPMFVMSILSDAQEAILHGDADLARQYINRAKFGVATYLDQIPQIPRKGERVRPEGCTCVQFVDGYPHAFDCKLAIESRQEGAKP